MRVSDLPSPLDIANKLGLAGMMFDGEIAAALQAYTVALGHLVWYDLDAFSRSQCDETAAPDRPLNVCRADADRALAFLQEALRVSGALEPRGIR